jgi:Mg-chelatase subunit ChlD
MIRGQKEAGKSGWLSMMMACLLTAGLTGCSSANFDAPTGTAKAGPSKPANVDQTNKSGKSGKRGDADGSSGGQGQPQSLALSCAELADPETATVEILRDKDGKPRMAELTGSICPKPQRPSKITVLFLIDWSGSMQTMDPKVGDSCGRLQAAKAITNYIKNSADPQTVVQEGMIPFSTAVDHSGIIPLADVDTFAQSLVADKFCRAAGATNYHAPLQQARYMLQGAQGRVVIYFITDGAPNVKLDGTFSFDNDPQVIGHAIDAGRQLKDVTPGVTLNSILLGAQAATAQSTMTNVTGDPNRVKLVSNATDLAGSILKFEPPTLVPTSATATLTSGGVSKTVAIAEINPDPDNPGNWIYKTEPFSLDGVDGTLEVEVKDSDGGSSKSTAKVGVKPP